jgi:hypothetical protein
VGRRATGPRRILRSKRSVGDRQTTLRLVMGLEAVFPVPGLRSRGATTNDAKIHPLIASKMWIFTFLVD